MLTYWRDGQVSIETDERAVANVALVRRVLAAVQQGQPVPPRLLAFAKAAMEGAQTPRGPAGAHEIV